MKDEENILKLIKSFLSEEGYRVKTFLDGEALLEAFKKEKAYLVILDVCMPKKMDIQFAQISERLVKFQ